MPWGAARVWGEAWLGFTEVVMPGCPNPGIADPPFPAPAGNSSTRLLPLSATNKSPFGPIATPLGVLSDAAFTAADNELVKSNCPITTSGEIRPLWFTGRGYRSTRLFPESAPYRVPSLAFTAIPSGDERTVLEGFGDPCVSTFATPVRKLGCPTTSSAGSPLRNRTESFHTSTRLFEVSETYSANGADE